MKKVLVALLLVAILIVPFTIANAEDTTEETTIITEETTAVEEETTIVQEETTVVDEETTEAETALDMDTFIARVVEFIKNTFNEMFKPLLEWLDTIFSGILNVDAAA